MIKTRVLLALLLTLSLTNASHSRSEQAVRPMVQDKAVLQYQAELGRALTRYRDYLGQSQTLILMPELMKVMSYPKMSDEYREAKHQYDFRLGLWQADKRDFDRHYQWLGQHNVWVSRIDGLIRKYHLLYNVYKPKYIDKKCHGDNKCIHEEFYAYSKMEIVKSGYVSWVGKLKKLEKQHPIARIRPHRRIRLP